MTPRESKFKSKKFDNLYKYPQRSSVWIYRRFSKEKNEEFSFPTGEESNERLAHKVGEEAFHRWLGVESIKTRPILFGEYAQEYLDQYQARTDRRQNSKRTLKIAVTHLLDAFGHLRLNQITEEAWTEYCTKCSLEKPQKFFNRRKELNAIMRKAHRNGVIQRLPEFDNPDPETEAGQYLPTPVVRRILANCSDMTRLLATIVWLQGARPGEALQYEWDMIDWKSGPHGQISIPGRITKTKRSRAIPLNSMVSKRLREKQGACTPPAHHLKYIFEAPHGADAPMKDWTTGWDAARRRTCEGLRKSAERARLSKRPKVAKELEGYAQLVERAGIYDLRRTFITNQARAKRSILFVAKYTDTSIQMIEKFYAKVQQDVLREIAE